MSTHQYLCCKQSISNNYMCASILCCQHCISHNFKGTSIACVSWLVLLVPGRLFCWLAVGHKITIPDLFYQASGIDSLLPLNHCVLYLVTLYDRNLHYMQNINESHVTIKIHCQLWFDSPVVQPTVTKLTAINKGLYMPYAVMALSHQVSIINMSVHLALCCCRILSDRECLESIPLLFQCFLDHCHTDMA